MLKLYFEDSLIKTNDYLSFLVPILWIPDKHIWWESELQISNWYNTWKMLIERTDNKQESDYFVFPVYFNLDLFDELKSLSIDAKALNKKVLVFYTSDIEDYIDINDNIIWFKRSLNCFWPQNEYSLPAFPNNLTYEVTLDDIDKSIYKSISIWYTWYSNYYNLKTFLLYYCLQFSRIFFSITFIRKLLLKTKNEHRYHLLTTLWIWKYVRWKIISELKKTNNINFNYIERKTWLYIDVKEKLRQEYLDNIKNSLFSLVVRWNWNYSFRLYEVLSLWKIPLFVDTNSKLPFADEIDYKSLFIYVPFSDIKNIWKYVFEFYEKNKNNLVNIENEIRKIYLNYFVMEKYYEKIISKLS